MSRLCPEEAASAVTFPRTGQDLCAKCSLRVGEADGGSNAGLAVGISTSHRCLGSQE